MPLMNSHPFGHINCDCSTKSEMWLANGTFELRVLSHALIAFSHKYSRIVVAFEDVCYTVNSAKSLPPENYFAERIVAHSIGNILVHRLYAAAGTIGGFDGDRCRRGSMVLP
jgi:hypothetical protein